MSASVRSFFNHEIGFKIDFPVEDDADVKEAVFFDLEVRGECVFMPAEKNARGDGFDVHGGRLYDASVLGGVLDHFFVEHLVLAPAGYGVKFFEMIREGWDVEIASHAIGRVAVLLADFKVFADHELKKADLIVFHAENINQ